METGDGGVGGAGCPEHYNLNQVPKGTREQQMSVFGLGWVGAGRECNTLYYYNVLHFTLVGGGVQTRG